MEATFGCQLAKVGVTVLSAVFFQSIGKRPGEHSWVRNIPGPQQTAMLLQLGSLGEAQQRLCRCLTVPSCCGDSPWPPVEHLAGNTELELTSLMPFGAF